MQMSDENRLEIPRRIDDKAKFLWWDFDQAMLVMLFIVLGIVANSLSGGIFLGLLAGYAYNKARSGKHPAFAIHLMYWYLPEWAMKFKRLPPSHQVEFTG